LLFLCQVRSRRVTWCSVTKSRMMGDYHVRFREKLRVKFPWFTRRVPTQAVPKMMGLAKLSWPALEYRFGSLAKS
ncbi:hypothetical protein, partial [Bacteroides sp. 51]|uniref:hypothetical protein n=1 Tax=Bacteroides sp. 51 TaxID=2302938 RepID=UPI0019403301